MNVAAASYRVVVVRNVDMEVGDTDADMLVTAESPAQAAAQALRSIGGGYADYIGLSPPGDVRMDEAGFVEDVCFMYCQYHAGVFSYDVRL